MKNRTKKLSLTALYGALALITFLLENLVPSFFVPGAKMGLGNIFVMLALYTFGVGEAFCVFLVKCILGNLLSGTLSSMLFSFLAGATSLLACCLLWKFAKNKISLPAVSVAGAVINNIVQNLIYAFLTQTVLVLSYLPYLALVGALSGAITGIITALIVKKVPKI